MTKTTNAAGEDRHVLIVGGGFAGVGCARKLMGAPGIRLTLLDRNNYHQFQPLLYQVATSQLAPSDAGFPLRRVLPSDKGDVTVVDVASVDPAARTVTTRDGQVFAADILVIAAGAEAEFFSTPGAAEHALPLYSLSDAVDLRTRIFALFEDVDRDRTLIDRGALRFVVVGGGPTGVEVAGALADITSRILPTEYGESATGAVEIHLVDHGDQLLSAFPDKAHAYARKVLEREGVQLHMGVGVAEVASDHVILSDGQRLDTHCTIWGGGTHASGILADSGLPIGHGGRVGVASDLTVDGFEGVYVIGDCANITGSDGSVLPQLGSVALQSGEWAAKNIRADLAGEARKPFKYHDKGAMAMIGRNAAVADLGPIELHGPVAFAAWLGVHAVLLTGVRNRIDSFISWAWDYFGASGGPQTLVRGDEPRIRWDDDETETVDAGRADTPG